MMVSTTVCWLTWVSLLALFCGANVMALDWYPCMRQPESYNLTLGNAFLEVKNTTVFLYARNNYTDTVLTESFIALTFRGIQEWHTTGGSCDEPVDPTDSDDNSYPYTALLVEEMECALSIENDTLPGGRVISSVVTRARHPSYSDLAITFNITKSFGTYERTYIGVPTTNNIPYVIRYKTGSYKVTLAIDNFPYSGPMNQTHLVGYLTGAGKMNEDGIIKYQEQPDMLKFSLNATNPNSTLRFLEDLDRGFLLDDVAYMNSMPHDGQLQPLPANFPFALNFSFAFCQYYPPGFRVKHLYWDPQLTVLFDAVPPEEEEPLSPDTPLTVPAIFKKKVQLGLAVGLSVGAIALIGAFIAIYAFSPKLQAIFQPYKNADNSAVAQKAVNSRWSAAHGGSSAIRNTAS